MASKSKVYVIGVGQTKFEKPGKRDDDYPDMGKEAITKALSNAKITYTDVKAATAGWIFGDSTSGQRAIYEVGLSGIPIYNVNNNAATGSTAIMLAKQIVEAGSDCVLALGFEKMERGPLAENNARKFKDRTHPLEAYVLLMAELSGLDKNSPVLAQMFGNAGIEHMKKYGTKPEHFAKIAYKNHLHSINNSNAQFQDKKYTLEDIMNSPKIFGPLTKLQCCPTSDGAAAVVLANEEFVRRHRLEDQAIEIVGMEMCTDLPSTFTKSHINIVGYDMTKTAAEKLFTNTNYRPMDVDVIELHDCFSTNELITYEALGLCAPGKAGELIDSGNNTYGGKYVINPSGGLISKGHPLGASGVAQCIELCLQLRGDAGRRQVSGAKLALQHNIGLGGAAVVALYRKGFPKNDELHHSQVNKSENIQAKL